MQLCAVRDNYMHFHGELVSQVFLDPLEEAEEMYIPPANPTPPPPTHPQVQNPTVPPTPHVSRGNPNNTQAQSEIPSYITDF